MMMVYFDKTILWRMVLFSWIFQERNSINDVQQQVGNLKPIMMMVYFDKTILWRMEYFPKVLWKEISINDSNMSCAKFHFGQLKMLHLDQVVT